MSQVQVRSFDNLVAFNDKKGNTHNITPEGAIFKGGAALKALKVVALDIAFEKGKNGRYRAAAEIMGAAFPSIHKAAVTFLGTSPDTNKATFQVFAQRIHDAKPGKSGNYTDKQVAARMLAACLLDILAPKAPEIVEAQETTQEAAEA